MIIKTDKLIINFNDTGICKIDLNYACKYFDNKCCISKYGEEYRIRRDIYKYICNFKVTISKEDALYIIEKLNLIEEKSCVFRRASTFRKAKRGNQ